MPEVKEAVKKCSVSDIKPNTYYSRISYGKVLRPGSDSLGVQNEDGLVWQISSNIFEQEFYTHDQYDEANDKHLPKTLLAEAFVTETGDAVFSVCFIKQNGEERVMVGRRVGGMNLLGYSNVYDMEKQSMRQVNHNTLKWFICKNTRYLLK